MIPNTYKIELIEMELFICIKMDLTLITYNGCFNIKQNQAKPPISQNIQKDEKDMLGTTEEVWTNS